MPYNKETASFDKCNMCECNLCGCPEPYGEIKKIDRIGTIEFMRPESCGGCIKVSNIPFTVSLRPRQSLFVYEEFFLAAYARNFLAKEGVDATGYAVSWFTAGPAKD